MLMLHCARQQDQKLARSFDLYTGASATRGLIDRPGNRLIASGRQTVRFIVATGLAMASGFGAFCAECSSMPARVDEALQAAINRRTKTVG